MPLNAKWCFMLYQLYTVYGVQITKAIFITFCHWEACSYQFAGNVSTQLELAISLNGLLIPVFSIRQYIIAERLSTTLLILLRMLFCVVCMSITLRTANSIHCARGLVFPASHPPPHSVPMCDSLLRIRISSYIARHWCCMDQANPE